MVLKHIGIIMDGNRRFSKKLMLEPWKGHEWGAKKVKQVIEWCKEFGIKEVTLYAFSIENFNRPKEEFDHLMNLFKREFDRLATPKQLEKLNSEGIRINFIGRIEMFPKKVYESMKTLMKKTARNKRYIVNFAMAYGGRAEIVDAVKRIAHGIKKGKIDVNNIDEKLIEKNLYMRSEPDLIIRTSGEQRTSGFLIWQGSYAELFFCKKYWPEFEKADLAAAIADYNSRERRFGR